MIFLLLVVLYLLIGVLLVSIELSDEEGRRNFENTVNDFQSQCGVSQIKGRVILVVTAILLWPMFVKSSRSKK